MLWLLPIAAATRSASGCTDGDTSFDYFLFVRSRRSCRCPAPTIRMQKGCEVNCPQRAKHRCGYVIDTFGTTCMATDHGFTRHTQ